MKNRFAAFLAVALVMSLLAVYTVPVVSAESTVLLTVNGKSVTDDMTLSGVDELFGQPVLSTPSAFGGLACTYYGEDYADYVYLETAADGRIVSYGTFTPGFTSNKKSCGDTDDSTVRYMQGYYATDYSDNIWGGCFYNCTAADISTYKENWNADTETYRRGLVRHAVLMFNAVSKVIGGWDDVHVTFDETVFLTNEQLKANGSDFYAYGNATGKSAYISLISKGMDSLVDYSYLPNPLIFAKYGSNYHINGNATAAAFYSSIGSSAQRDIYFVDPAILEQGAFVPMTEREQALLKAARAEYAASVELFNSSAADGYFETDYQYETLPLEAGVMKEGILEATLGYLNAIRIGAGLEKLTLSSELCNSAQHKAVLTAYMAANDISNPNPHYPPKPDGVSDEFYNQCHSYSGENLYHNSILGGDFVIGSVQNALQEAYGDVIACGHRYNLLDPTWKNIGFGSCNGQGVHQMSGYQASGIEMVAWPPEGIMLTDANRDSYRWTMLFYNDSYQVTDETTVTVTNLNTQKSWVEKTGVSDFQVIGDDEISFFDENIAYTVGDICEVRIENLKRDGLPADYTYRTVFASVSDSGAESVSSVTISDTALIMKAGDSFKLSAAVDDAQADNQLLFFSSSDESVATVLPNGRIEAHAPGKVTVTVTSDANKSACAYCTVTVYAALPDDLTGDGLLNMQDALLLYRCVAGEIAMTDEQKASADLDKDGRILLSDAMQLYRLVSGR